MKKVILMAVVVLIAFTVNSCRKETEKIIERVEVQKGNQILSGTFQTLTFMELKQHKVGELLLV